MNSERVKQIEMENILSQGDLQALIENCNKQITKCDQQWKDQLEEVMTFRDFRGYICYRHSSNLIRPLISTN